MYVERWPDCKAHCVAGDDLERQVCAIEQDMRDGFTELPDVPGFDKVIATEGEVFCSGAEFGDFAEDVVLIHCRVRIILPRVGLVPVED